MTQVTRLLLWRTVIGVHYPQKCAKTTTKKNLKKKNWKQLNFKKENWRFYVLMRRFNIKKFIATRTNRNCALWEFLKYRFDWVTNCDRNQTIDSQTGQHRFLSWKWPETPHGGAVQCWTDVHDDFIFVSLVFTVILMANSTTTKPTGIYKIWRVFKSLWPALYLF